MRPRSFLLIPLATAALGLTVHEPATAQAQAQAQSPDTIVRQALQSNPVLAPYHLSAFYRNRQMVLSGTVGSKQLHDLAIRLAIAAGYPVRDDLVIDTGAAHRVAALAAQQQTAADCPASQAAALSLGGGSATVPFVYPPPLFGRIDDPFFGYEPPLLTYPPWWRALAAREAALAPPPSNSATGGVVVPNMSGGIDPSTGQASAFGNGNGNAVPGQGQGPISIPLGASPQDGAIEMTIDSSGRAVLRGTVPSLADRILIGQQIARTAGVSEVLNLLQVAVKTAGTVEKTPPPPQPGTPASPEAPQLQPMPQGQGQAQAQEPARRRVRPDALTKGSVPRSWWTTPI